jgi:hypothetical protein
MGVFSQDFAHLDFAVDPSLKVWCTGEVEKARCLDIAALLRGDSDHPRLHLWPSTIGLHSLDIVELGESQWETSAILPLANVHDGVVSHDASDTVELEFVAGHPECLTRLKNLHVADGEGKIAV